MTAAEATNIFLLILTEDAALRSVAQRNRRAIAITNREIRLVTPVEIINRRRSCVIAARKERRRLNVTIALSK
jgi:hypothetical protein